METFEKSFVQKPKKGEKLGVGGTILMLGIARFVC